MFDRSSGVETQIRQGPCFRYAVPAGWQVVEDGQFAVVLMAPDQRALTVMVGNSGLPAGYDPAQFVHEKISQLRPDNLRLWNGRPAPPMPGFSTAFEFDLAYAVRGIPCRGVARCNVAPAYDMCTMAVTYAASEESQWGTYATWLPQLASQVAIVNASAFGALGIAQQALANSIALGEQARQNREHSQHQWDEVTRQRADSQDRNNFAFRENLGNVQTYTNPYGYQTLELSTQYSHYWMNRHGQVVGTNDPTGDPNVGSRLEWSRMTRHQQ